MRNIRQNKEVITSAQSRCSSKPGRRGRALILALAAVMAVFVFAACGNAPEQAADEPAAGQTDTPSATEPADSGNSAGSGAALSGSVTIAGSTSVQPLSDVLAEAFMAANQGVTVDVQGGGSGQGIKALQDRLADFGSLSRAVKDEEKEAVVEEYVIAKDGIAVIVNKGDKIDDLTLEQLKDIFTGKITNWKDVGGDDAKINVVAREEGSGTRDAFNELTKVAEDDKDNTVDSALIQNSTGAVAQTVESTKNSIGYISLGSLGDTVKAIKVGGVAPSRETVLDSSYAISRPFLYARGGDLSPQAQAYVDFVMGAEGQAIVEEEGFISAV